MKIKWLAIMALASAVALSAHAQLALNWTGVASVNSFGFTTATVALSGITSNSATKGTDSFVSTAATVTNFGGTGSLSVDFFGGDAFNLSTWAFTPQNLSGSNTRGLGVNTSADGTTQNRLRGINATEAIVFTINSSSLVASGQQLQFRVGTVSGSLYLYKQTGANSGAALQSGITAGTSSSWFDVDGLKTFAVRNDGSTAAAQFATLEFQVVPAGSTNTPGKVNVFMLSGQSNMANWDPNDTFIPLINAAFTNAENIFVKVAQKSQPISRWVPEDSTEPGVGDLYRELYTNTVNAVAGKTVDNYTFVWMQGERDAKIGTENEYESNLRTLYSQLTNDFGTVNMVIGRINDSSTSAEWGIVRQAQMTVGDDLVRGTWIDTDSFNDPGDTLHPSEANDWGYDMMAAAFAEASIHLINAFAAGTNVAPSAVIDESDGVVFLDNDNNGSQSVTLHGGNSSDSDGTIASWMWMQGTNTLGVGQTLNHTLNVRTNVVSLIVHDNAGTPDVATIKVMVIPPSVFGDQVVLSNLVVGANTSFQWNAVSGRVYQVYWSSNLVNGFTRIATNLVNGFYMAPTPNTPSGFYKLEVDIDP